MAQPGMGSDLATWLKTPNTTTSTLRPMSASCRRAPKRQTRGGKETGKEEGGERACCARASVRQRTSF
eukprot:754316-Rhodomonas_salina.1